MNHKAWKILSLLILLLALVSGSVAALMLRQTPQIVNQFDTSFVDCQVVETFDGDRKSSIQVTNTGNIEAYLRLRMVTYWADKDGNISGTKPSETISIVPSDAWFDGEYNTWYYRFPVAPGASTGNLLLSPLVLKQDGDLYQVVEVFAEAIQSLPPSAVAESWQVQVDSNKYLTP